MLFNAAVCRLDAAGDSFVSLLAWSHTDTIAAIATLTLDERNDTETFQVQLMNTDGEIIPNSSISHNCEALCIDWQPNGRVLAIGWADGLIQCWMIDGKSKPTVTFSNSIQHHDSAISVLKWNPYGKRLISGDKKGQICIWSVDPRGSLTPLRQYRKKGEISCAAFCVMNNVRATNENDDTSNKMIGSLYQVANKNNISGKTSPPFFFGTDKGAVIYADDLGHCSDVQQLSSSIDTMLFYEERSRLVIITRSLLLTQYQVADDGRVNRVMQVKLSVAGDVAEKGLKNVIWASPGLMAAATHEKLVRLLDIGADESYNLSLSAVGDIVERSDRVISVAFGPLDRYLAVGTQDGVIAIWKFNGPIRDVRGSRSTVPPTSSSDWELYYATKLPSPIHQLSWHDGQGTLGAVTDEGAVIFTESIMQNGICGNVSVTQAKSDELTVNFESLLHRNEIINISQKVGFLIKGLSVSRSCFVAWSNKYARVYRIDNQLQKIEPLEQFAINSNLAVIADNYHISEESLFIAEQSSIKICNLSGVQKGSITFSEVEGSPESIDINGKYLAVITNKGCIKILDVSTPTKSKQVGTVGNFDFSTENSSQNNGKTDSNRTLRVRCIKVNSNGTKVAILADHVEGTLHIRHPDSRLHVYDRNRGNIYSFDFAEMKRRPISIFWDESDDRMLACEALKNRLILPAIDAASTESPSSNESQNSEVNEVEVVTFFATSDNGLLMQDSFARKYPYGPMIGFIVPKLYFRDTPYQVKKSDSDRNESKESDVDKKIFFKVMRDFIGIDVVDDAVKLALLDFSYNLTLGKLDEAYRSVKDIDRPSIWENMAQMCVKTKRLDVAEVCLGHMGHSRGASAVRESKKYNNVDASVGVLAVQLGLLDDAARLFREANRNDLLNQLYQAAGNWEKAITISQFNDRIHLKNTHYHYAKHCESIGDVPNAIKHYELSGTSHVEVPRMLFTNSRMEELEEYVQRSNDPVLLKWWAAYLESNERYDKAKKYYKKADDYLSLVRIACYKGDLSKAAEIISLGNDRAAAYHFARQLENQNDYEQAINYYSVSGCYNHSIRLARAHGLDSELMKYALKSTPSLMLDCAAHFEERNEMEKAIQLYHKGGNIVKALDLCFKTAGEGVSSALNRTGPKNTNNANAAIFDLLNAIAQDLGPETSHTTLSKCAEFLMQHKQFDKAIELYVMAEQFTQAIEMCIECKVPINDNMVDKLTPPENMEPNKRKELLKSLASALKKQGLFTQASKKYTQAGDRVRAIKCLGRSGDTKAVIQFAGISRTPEIYTLAANYLQQMNWRESVDIMKAIITFYTKAKSFEQLAGFYDSCAQVEIDEYRDYEKAIGALKEAIKHLGKAESSRTVDNMLASLEKRISLIEKFVQARRLTQSEPDTVVSICETLLQDPLLEEAVRAGDCLAMLIENFHSRGRMREAYAYLQEMDERRIPIRPYIDQTIIEQIYKAVGVSAKSSKQNDMSRDSKSKLSSNRKIDSPERIVLPDADDEIVDDIDEEIEEEFETFQQKKTSGSSRPKSAANRKK